MKVLLDTNFLIDIVKFRVNLESLYGLTGAHELATLSSVIRELNRLSKQNSRTGGYARVALRLIKELGIEILKSESRPDEAFMKLTDDIVATNDVELRKRLKALGRKTIYLKSKKHLAIG